MRSAFIIFTLSVTFAAHGAEHPTLDETFASWEKTREEFKSLEVDFKFSVQSDVWNDVQHQYGTLRVIRDGGERLRAAGEMTSRDAKSRTVHFLFVRDS